MTIGDPNMVERTQHQEAALSAHLERITWRRSTAGTRLGLRAGVHGKQEWQVADGSERRAWRLEPRSKSVAPHPARSDNEREAETLIARLADGDEQAFADLYDGTNRIVYGLALRILVEPSAAEDVTMDVYMQVWRTAGSYESERGTVLTWLATLVRSRALDSLRRRKARRADLEDNVDEVPNLSDSRFCPELASLEIGRSRIVREAIDQLSPDQREAIELAYFSGLTHVEAAVHMGLPLGTVKTRIRSGMLQLRKLLEAYEGGTMNDSARTSTSGLHELASLYALGALDDGERKAFEEHLRQGCGTCADDVRSYSEVANLIGESVPAVPSARLRERLLHRISHSPRHPGILFNQGGLLIARSDELAWQTLAPGIFLKPLYEDAVRKYNTAIVRMDAGARYPSHNHVAIEELFMLSGDLRVEDQLLRAGDYCRADLGSIHGETFSDSGCLFLMMASQENQIAENRFI